MEGTLNATIQYAQKSVSEALVAARKVQHQRPFKQGDNAGRHLSLAVTELENAESRLFRALEAEA